MKTVLLLFYLLLAGNCFGQNIFGSYEQTNGGSFFLLRENGTFERSFVDLAFVDEGTFTIDSNLLTIYYKEDSYDKPKSIKTKISTTKRTDSLQKIEVKVIDTFGNNATDYYNIDMNGGLFFGGPMENIVIKIPPADTTFTVESASSPLEKFKITKEYNYFMEILVYTLVERKELFKILRHNEKTLVLKHLDFNLRIKYRKKPLTD